MKQMDACRIGNIRDTGALRACKKMLPDAVLLDVKEHADFRQQINSDSSRFI
jgi:hypothetical protein